MASAATSRAPASRTTPWCGSFAASSGRNVRAVRVGVLAPDVAALGVAAAGRLLLRRAHLVADCRRPLGVDHQAPAVLRVEELQPGCVHPQLRLLPLLHLAGGIEPRDDAALVALHRDLAAAGVLRE